MKKLFAGIITCATILLTGIGVSAAAADENNSGDENVQSEIVFCTVNSERTGRTSYSYGGFFIQNNGNVRHFYFEDIEDNWMLIFGSGSYSDDGNIELNAAMPHDKLLSRLNDNISEYKIVGNISEEEYNSQISLLSEIKVDAEIPFVPFEIAGMTSYTESFGVRYDNDDNAQIVFMNGHVSGDMKYRTYLENPDEKSIELNNWLIEKCKSFVSSELITTTAPTTPVTTTTTTVTTTEVKPNTEPSKNENEQSEIAFCVVNSERTGRTAYSYGGFFIENNGNVRTFSLENIEENFTFNAYWDVFHNAPKSIMVNESIPHDKLLSHLNDNISEYKIVGNISEEEYNSQISLLSEIKVDAEIPFVPFEIAGMTSYTESFGVRYDNDDNAQIVFMNGHVSGDMKYRTYLENPDEKSIELNNWLIEKCKSFMSSEPITTTAPTTPDATTTTTVTTTITAETNTEQITEPPTTDEGGSVTTETSTVPPTTTTGTETTLPQTGYSKWYQALIAAAMGMIGVGSTAIVRSGIFRKKESNS